MALRAWPQWPLFSGEFEAATEGTTLGKRSGATCDDCYFRQAGLCALPGNITCPTFRAATVGRLAPPPQPRLVLRPPAVTHGAYVAHAGA